MNTTLEELSRHIEQDEIVELTRTLVRMPSVVRDDGSDGEAETARFVADWMREQGLEVHTEEVHPGRPNVIGILHGSTPGKTILFEGHSDVVTEGDPEDWDYPPFEALLEGDRIYGRGTCDTKGNLAAALLAVSAIKRAGADFAGKIIVAVPVDEEGMMTGIKHLIQQGWADDVDAAIVCEPEDNQICITQKGALRGMLTSTGKMSHGCMPLTGFNPNVPLARIMLELQSFELREIDRLGYNEFLGFPSITPTVLRAPVSGEPQLNVMPRDSLAYLDIRTVPGQEHAELRQLLIDLVSRVEREIQEDQVAGPAGRIRQELGQHENLPDDISFKAKLDFIEDRPWTETAREDRIVQVVDKAVRTVTGQDPIYNGVPGATDGTFLWAWKNIPIVTIGAGDRMVPHQRNEWVSVRQLVETTRIYALSALEFLS